MTASSIKTATASEAESVISVLTLAFSEDPALRWIFPDPHEYITHSPPMIRAFAGGAFEHATAYYADGFAGAALWLPPEAHPDEDTMVSLLQQSITEARLEEVLGVFEQMGGYHPSEPHWYLPVIGVDPLHQGKGVGSALMQHSLLLCDREQQLAYLESSSPRNIPLYERFGFETVGTIQAGTSPSFWPMVRKPRIVKGGAEA